MGEVFEEFQSIFDISSGNMGEAVGGEGLAGEGGYDGAVDNGLADIVEGKFGFSGGSEVTGEGSEEGIARTGGVGDFGEGKGGAAEEIELGAREGEFGGGRAFGVFGKEDGSEFAEFDDNVGGTFIEQGLTGDDEIGGFAEISGLGFVDDEEVDFFRTLWRSSLAMVIQRSMVSAAMKGLAAVS